MSGGIQRILINALSGAGTRIAMMAIGFGLTPFIVDALGLQDFGLWAIIGSLAGYLGLLDFGLGGAFVKFITEFAEQENEAAARQVVTFGTLFYAAFGLALALPVYFFTPAAVHLFKMPANEIPTAVHVFRALFAVLIASMITGLPSAVVVSMHRMDLASRNNFIGYLAYAGLTVVLLRRGWGLNGVVIAQAIQVVVSATIQYATARSLFGPLWYNPLRFDGTIIRRLFAFGGWTQANAILNVIGLDVGRFISASMVSVASVSYYEFGSKLAFFSRSLPAYLLNAMLPAAAAADARSGQASLDRMYASGTFYSLFATLGIAGFLVGANDPIMRVWMGQTYPYVALVTMYIAIGYAVSALTGAGATILRAGGMPRYETYYTGVTAATNLLCTVALTPHFGVVGAAMGTGLGWCAGTAYFITIYHRIRRTPWWQTVGAPAVRFGASSTTSALALFALVHTSVAAPLFVSRTVGLLGLGFAGALYAAAYLILSWLSGAWRFDAGRLLPRAAAQIAA